MVFEEMNPVDLKVLTFIKEHPNETLLTIAKSLSEDGCLNVGLGLGPVVGKLFISKYVVCGRRVGLHQLNKQDMYRITLSGLFCVFLNKKFL